MCRILRILIVILIFASCSKDEKKIDTRDKLVGNWKVIDYHGKWMDKTDYCYIYKGSKNNEIIWSLQGRERDKKLTQNSLDSFSADGASTSIFFTEFNSLQYRNDTLFGERTVISFMLYGSYVNQYVMIKE